MLVNVLVKKIFEPAYTARGESPSAFGRRGIPPRGMAQRSNTPGILAFRALRSGRPVRLGATTDFHHGLVNVPPRWCPGAQRSCGREKAVGRRLVTRVEAAT